MQGRVEDIAGSHVGTHRLREAIRSAQQVESWSARGQYRRLFRWMALTDTLSVAAALLAGYWIRFGFRVPEHTFMLLLLATPLFVVAVFAAFHLYDTHHFTPAEEFRRIILAVSVGLTGLVTLSFWFQGSYSRGWIALSWGLSLLATLVVRRIWHWRVGRLRAAGKLTFRTIIVGTNREATHLEDVMRRTSMGYEPIGFVSTAQRDPSQNGHSVVGSIGDLREIIRETGAECVFVAASDLEIDEMGHVAKVVRLEGVEVRVTATLPEVLSSRLSVQPIGGFMALSLRPARLSGPQVVAKRVFDLGFATVGLLLTLPLWLLIAGMVKISSPGPVFFRQRRVGHRGRPFTILKFRTMRNGADDMLQELRALNEADGPLFKLRDDPRVTRAGRWLRRWSLDELPQILNVIRGDMSLVGPRPPLPEEVREYEEWQFDRLEVPPGITGLWQISGRSDLSFDEYVRLDLFYIENWSLAYDFFIVAKTLPVLLSKRGAY
jgi:exopolysaccharide biosynthesis polyprenyl glycosylphosphotransferase